MILRNVTVKIEYRMYAGRDVPRWKALRGRVMVVHPGRSVSYGDDLFAPIITNIDAAIAAALHALPHVETVHFVFDEQIGAATRSYLRGRLLPQALIL